MARAHTSRSTERVHFVASFSAAGSIKQALATLGRNEQVLPLGDELGVGPLLGYDDPRLRITWSEETLGDCWWSGKAIRGFWRAAVSSAITPVVWFSRHSVNELTCLHELVWRRREPPLVIDVAEVDFADPELRSAISLVRSELMVSEQLLDRARRLTSAEVDEYRTRWHWLRAENLDLRVMTPSGLVSVDLDYFDELMLSRVPSQWTTCANIIGAILTAPEVRGERIQAICDLFIWCRLLDFVDAGQLEGQGDFETYQTTWLRRP